MADGGSEHDDSDLGSDRLRRLLAGGTGTAAGLGASLIVGPAGALVGPAVSEAVDALIDKASSIRRRNGERVLEEAAQHAGVAPGEFVERAEGDDRVAQLIAEALTAGSLTDITAKITALAESMAAGALSDDEVVLETERLAIATLAQLEKPQLRLLHLLATEDHELGVFGQPAAWSLDAIRRAAPELDGLVVPVVTTLERLGLVSVKGTDWAEIIQREREVAERQRTESQRREEMAQRGVRPITRSPGPRQRSVSGSFPPIRAESDRWEITKWGVAILTRVRMASSDDDA